MNKQIEEIAEILKNSTTESAKYFQAEVKKAFRNGAKDLKRSDCKKSIHDIAAEALYNAGYRKISYGEVTLSPEERDFVMKTITDIRAERDELKAENERLTERLKQVLLSIDTVKEMNAMCNIDEQRKQAVKEFAERIKNEVYPFLQAEMYNKKYFIMGNIESDICREHQNQNIGIIKAQDVLSKWFKVKIDELLKEYQI